MRIVTTPATETQVYENGGFRTVTVPDGTVTISGSIFHVQRVTTSSEEYGTRTETHLIGARGTVYLARPYMERKGDSGIRQVVSLNTGAPLRKHGNEIRVIEIGGIIEQYNG